METDKRRRERNSGNPSQPRTRTPGSCFLLHAACRRNAGKLLAEAELLAEHGHHERAFFLAVAAYEELGKSEIVADFISDVVSREEFEEAFRSHAFKIAFHERYIQMPSGELKYHVERSKTTVDARNAALYVGRSPSTDEPLEPSDMVTPESALEMIKQVHEVLDDIIHAEWLNGRLGSKGLFK